MTEILDRKIHSLNKLAVEIDEWCHTTHPSAWNELNKDRIKEYKRLAKEIGTA